MRSLSDAIFVLATTAVLLAAGCEPINERQSAQEPVAEEVPAAAEPTTMPMTGGMPAAGSMPMADSMMSRARESCPMVVEGAQVEVADTDDGVALTFTTTSGDVADLRMRVGHMAQMYTMHDDHQQMMWQHMAGAQGGGMMGAAGAPGGMGPGPERGMAMGTEAEEEKDEEMGHGRMPAATPTVEEIEGGARLLLVPTEAARLEDLRAHVRVHHERMHAGDCAMLHPAQM